MSNTAGRESNLPARLLSTASAPQARRVDGGGCAIQPVAIGKAVAAIISRTDCHAASRAHCAHDLAIIACVGCPCIAFSCDEREAITSNGQLDARIVCQATPQPEMHLRADVACGPCADAGRGLKIAPAVARLRCGDGVATRGLRIAESAPIAIHTQAVSRPKRAGD